MKGINFAIAMGIAILLPLLVVYGVNTFSPPPKWEDFHHSEFAPGLPEKESPGQIAQRAETYQREMERMNEAKKQYQMRLFYTAVPVGLLSILIGTFVRIPALGSGMVFGGVFTLVEGYVFNWARLDDPIKFVSLLIALIALGIIAHRRTRE